MDKALILNKLKEHKKFTTNVEFARFIGITPQNLRNWFDRKTYDINKLCSAFPEISVEWLTTGKGEMLKYDGTSDSFQEAEQKEQNKRNDVILVPVLNLDVRGGFNDNEQTDIREYVDGMIPFSNKIARSGDFVLPLFGDSMYPRYPSGSQLLVRPVESWKEYLEFGNSYVIELNDGRRIVKIVKKGSDKDHFLLVSVNPDFEPQEIPVSIIQHVFLVKMMLKKEGA